ncbi:MAG: tetratricopeptide repeat protein, partial [Gemmatimonadales bacterium]
PLTAQKVVVTEKMEVLEARARQDSNDAAAHYNVAMGYWSKKRYGDAEQALRTAVGLDPQFADAYLAMGILHNWDDDFWSQRRKAGGDTAVKTARKELEGYYRKAFLIDPLVDVKILGATWKLGGYSRFLRAFEDLVEGRYDQAFDKFDKELQYWKGSQTLDSLPWGMVWLHGLAAAHSNHPEAAITDLGHLVDRASQAEQSDSTDDTPLEVNEYRYMIAVLKQRGGQAGEAVNIYQQVLTTDIGNYMAHVQLARVYEGVRDFERAVQERRRAVETNPDDSSLLLDLGLTLGKAGRFQEASEALTQASEANPRDSRSYYWLGIANVQLSKKEDARAAFNRFLELAPSRYADQIAAAKQRIAQLQ